MTEATQTPGVFSPVVHQPQPEFCRHWEQVFAKGHVSEERSSWRGNAGVQSVMIVVKEKIMSQGVEEMKPGRKR